MSKFGPTADIWNPEAVGVCDRGGEQRRLRELKKEMVWSGSRLIWNGMLCCDKHRDPPHPFDRLLVLPPDPVPVPYPRPEQLMVPVPGFVTDGTPTVTESEGYVMDVVGVPVMDHAPVKYPE